MSRRLKRVEELNMEPVVELTVEEKTQAFKEWVNQKLDTCESFLSISVHHLEYWLNQREPIREERLNNEFEFTYVCINDFVKEATRTCQAEKLPEDVLANAIAEFKKLKSKARKVKAEYKQKFIELKEAIALAQEDEDYVNEIRKQVQDIIIRWCSTYVICDYCKASYEGEKLLKTVASVTRWLLDSKLHPDEHEVEEFVEKYMTNQTETVAC